MLPVRRGVRWKWRELRAKRGLPGGQSLASLLEERRQRRHLRHLPDLTVQQILSWADAYRIRTGAWPLSESGAIPDSGGETWHAVNNALRKAVVVCRGAPPWPSSWLISGGPGTTSICLT